MRNKTFAEIKDNMDMFGCYHIVKYGSVAFECQFNTAYQAKNAEKWLNEQIERLDGEITNVERDGNCVLVDIK